LKIGKLRSNKIFIVIVAVIIVGGTVFWEYTGTAEFCALCHTDAPYVESWKSSKYLDHKHYLVDVTCDDCHVPPGSHRIFQMPKYMLDGIDYVTGNYEYPFPEGNYSKDYCLKCHGTYDELAQKTSNVKPNPHQHHLGEIECGLCHKSHRPFVNHCAECHDWNFKRSVTTSNILELTIPKNSILNWILASLAAFSAISIVLANTRQEN
jgi:hypothetical protein